jgi:hypothetical protein
LPLDPVVDRAVRGVALRAGETAAALLEGDDQMEPARLSGLAFKAAVGHDPRAAQRKGFGKEVVRVHPSTELISAPCQAVFHTKQRRPKKVDQLLEDGNVVSG